MPLHRQLIPVCYLLITLFPACTPTPGPPKTNIFTIIRLSPPALLQFSEDLQPIKEIPLSLPPDCSIFDLFSPPRGIVLAVELSCSFGQSVLFLDTETGSASQAFSESDSHFLAWASDGQAAFLKVDSAGNPRIIRAYPASTTLSAQFVPITELTYDLAPKPNSPDFVFTFSRGLVFGSEMWLAQKGGRVVQHVYADQSSYISLARWSPNGKQIAFIKIPDSQTPFTVGGLWLMNADGSNAHKLADADAGHGYAVDWSPDGTRLAFVVRENVDDPRANESAEALISNLYIVDIASREISQVTKFTEGRAETPHWSPDGNMLAFQYVLNGRMDLQVVDLLSGEVKAILTEPACCPSWMRK